RAPRAAGVDHRGHRYGVREHAAQANRRRRVRQTLTQALAVAVELTRAEEKEDMSGAVPVDDGRCFACGPYSADGLHMHFEPDGEGRVRADLTLPPRFQGWRGTAHGGIVMMLLDEAMAYACGAICE